MTTLIKDENQLRTVMEEITEKAIKIVSERVSLILFNRINRDVYTTPNKWYLNGSGRPSYEFRDKAWKWKDIEKIANQITRELFYNWQEMSVDRKGWQHWSNVRGWEGDSRPYLASILNDLHNDPYTSSLMIGKRHFSHARRRYWDNFIDELFAKKKLDLYFTDAFRSLGVKRFS